MSLEFKFELESEGWTLLIIHEDGYKEHKTTKGRWNNPKWVKVWQKGSIKVAELMLTQGVTTLIDLEDLDKVCKFNWCAAKDSVWGYRVMRHNKGSSVKLLHTQICGITEPCLVDHINNEYPDSYALDNRKSNLRITDKNTHNVRKYISNTTGYSNVIAVRDSYNVQVTVGGRRPYCPYFKDLGKALKCRDLFKAYLHNHEGQLSKDSFRILSLQILGDLDIEDLWLSYELSKLISLCQKKGIFNKEDRLSEIRERLWN